MNNAGKLITIVLADDDPDDRQLTEEAFVENRLANQLHCVQDGEELLDYLHRRGSFERLRSEPLPGLILLDLNMPRKDGREALKEIKADPNLRRIPIVVLTTSKAEEDIVRAYNLHANAYITKPVGLTQFFDVIRALEGFWLAVVTLPPNGNGKR